MGYARFDIDKAAQVFAAWMIEAQKQLTESNKDDYWDHNSECYMPLVADYADRANGGDLQEEWMFLNDLFEQGDIPNEDQEDYQEEIECDIESMEEEISDAFKQFSGYVLSIESNLAGFSSRSIYVLVEKQDLKKFLKVDNEKLSEKYLAPYMEA